MTLHIRENLQYYHEVPDSQANFIERVCIGIKILFMLSIQNFYYILVNVW